MPQPPMYGISQSNYLYLVKFSLITCNYYSKYYTHWNVPTHFYTSQLLHKVRLQGLHIKLEISISSRKAAGIQRVYLPPLLISCILLFLTIHKKKATVTLQTVDFKRSLRITKIFRPPDREDGILWNYGYDISIFINYTVICTEPLYYQT